MSDSSSKFSKDFLFNLLSKAGRGKDEVIEVLGKEIGAAIAALWKKPFAELIKHNKIQITLELVPKSLKKKSVVKDKEL